MANRYVRNSKGQIYTDISFTPSLDDPKVGVVSINDSYGEKDDNGNYNYTYDEKTKNFTLVKLDDNFNVTDFEVKIKIEFDENYGLVFTNRRSSTALNVFSYELMVSRIEWNGRALDGAWYTFSFKEDGTGRFGYSKSNENYEQIASYSCDIKYSAYLSGENVIIELDDESINKIKESGIVSSISIITGDTKYASFEFTVTAYGKTEVITLHQGG
jgi:hypothetical protein